MLLKAFRLFVSSTFADFAAEREALQTKVFPALDTYCAAKGYQFYPLDMRWGISEEAGRDQRTADICLEEVEAVHGYPPPNFLILLGDRYGWVPLPFAIARDEFEAMLAWLEANGDRGGAAAVRDVYRLDENRLVRHGIAAPNGDPEAHTAAYTLLSREDDLPKLKDRDAWSAVEAKVRSALQAGADALLREGRITPMTRDKYFLSLTEREIRGNFDASSKNARGTEAIAFIRTLDGPCDAFRESDPSTSAAVAALVERVGRTLAPDRIARGTAKCNASGISDPDYLSNFASAVEARIKAAIDRHIAKVEAIERGPDYALASERVEHRDFRAEKLKVFVGRESNLAAIAAYVAGETTHPLVLHGRSGTGKSALMAQASAAAEQAGRGPCVTRFIGASASSSDLRALLISVIDDLADQGLVDKPAEYYQDANKFAAQMKALLASINGPAVIFLDALDQLKKPYRLDWLPQTLPAGVRLVLSVLDDPAYEADNDIYQLRRWHRLSEDALLAIEPLTREHGRDMLLALEAQGKRHLRESQRDLILRHFEAARASPLYLRTAFEIARSWRGWEADAGRHVLAADTTGLIAQFIADLTSEQHHAAALVTRTLGVLAAAKDGLSAKEITEVLARDAGVMTAISSKKHGHDDTGALPPSVWVRLHRALEPFLIEKRIDGQPLLYFFHRQVAEVARQDHYEPTKTTLHATLATYFEGRATKEGDRAIYEKRSLSELPYQLHHVGDASHAAHLNDILLSPDWMQQKLAAFASPLPLIEDYRTYSPYDPANKTASALVGRALGQSAGALGRDERQLVPHLLGRLDGDMAPGMGEVITNARLALRPPALIPRVPRLTLADSALLWIFEGHDRSVDAVAFSPNGKLIVSGSADYNLRLWDVESRLPLGMPLRGHDSGTTAVAFSPDGLRIVSGGHDDFLRLWDTENGAEIGEPWKGHNNSVTTVAFSPDGLCLASGSRDAKLRLWNTENGATIGVPLEGHSGSVAAVAFSPDGLRLVSGSDDGTLRQWDAKSGAANGAPLEGHSASVNAVAFSPCGRRIVSGSSDGTLRLWDAATGATIGAPLEGHSTSVHAVAYSPCGRRIVSGSWDGTLRVWDAESGAAVGSIEGHDQGVNAVAFAPDGRRLVSGSNDNTLRLWDLESDATIGQSLNGGDRSAEAADLFVGERQRAAGCNCTSSQERESVSEAAVNALLDSNWVTVTALSPNGHLIVAGSDDGTLRLCDAVSGAVVWSLSTGHDGAVTVVAFSPDGRRLISGSDDKSLLLWSTKTGAELARFEGDASIETVASIGEMFTASDTLGRLHVLDWIPDEAAKVAWLARFDAARQEESSRPAHPAPPPADIVTAPPEMRVTAADLAGARHLETYRCRHLFALTDGRVYINGLIAVGSLDHARATLNELARRAGEPDA